MQVRIYLIKSGDIDVPYTMFCQSETEHVLVTKDLFSCRRLMISLTVRTDLRSSIEISSSNWTQAL
ncbi:uncharacterized protein RAG0_09639 [Rhynchosporium agropyri]|uniref:Uncharacterized protein n=1 Tax=Rhynchosporium agropyri TaxID=914238 RepID=A0A1E1KWC4_9HELO|nr:uncharacterized protein RAG0_09639 [Rhynchosporium agropyri]